MDGGELNWANKAEGKGMRESYSFSHLGKCKVEDYWASLQLP